MGQSTSQQPCSNCGILNNIADDFCSSCGFALKGMATGTIASGLNTPTMISAAGRRITGALASGMVISARYNVVRLLGRGGFGAVYLASDTRFPARRVAVKEMGDAQLSSRDRALAIANFRQEADLLSRLQHPNMPTVSDFFEEGGKAYMVMEFIDGQTLDEVQQATGGPLNEALVMGWVLQICEVLDYLHSQPQPIIFRDLKPANIMVTPSGQIKLIDFGIARIFRSNATKDTNSLGSQGYAAPEQYGLEQTDARTDIYALGATIYDLLTNQVPQASFVRKVNPQSFVPPRQLNSRISPGVEHVIVTAMEIEKRQRYQSAADMSQAIIGLGFSIARNTGGMRTLTGPNAVTAVSTQPGNYITSSTINPAPTQANVPNTPNFSQGPAVASMQQGGLTLTTPAQLNAQATPPQITSTQQPGPAGQYAGMPSFQAPAQTPAGPTPPPGGWPGGTGGPVSPQGGPSGRVSRRALLVGGSVAVAAAATGIYFVAHSRSATPAQSAGDTITIDFAYSTEKASWLQPVVDTFNKSNSKLNNNGKVIQVQLTDLGSVDSVSQILHGQLKPIAWSPASTLEINRLNYKWQQIHGGASLISSTEQFQPRSLVKSPLVFAAWKQRAQVLLNHYGVSTLDWDTLYSAFQVNDWQDVGGPSGWGPIKFGQTVPTQSNSGLLTITLLAYHYFHEARNLTVTQIADANYQQRLKVFEDAVNTLGSSSGTYLKNDIIDGPGPAQADVIATYESLVLTLHAETQSRQHQDLLIYYPSLNILSDHPFAVLQGDWVMDEEKQAALQFRDFLLAVPQQRQALANGFRPVNPAVSLNGAGSPFTSLSSLFPNSQPDSLQALAQAPAGDVVDALINTWSQRYADRPVYD